MKKTLIWLLVALLLLTALGCSGGKDDDPNLGVYTATTAEYLGISIDVGEFVGSGFTIELKSGGKCKMTLDGATANGKWTLDGTAFHVEGGGIDCTGTLSDGLLKLDYDGVTFNMEKGK